MILVFPTFFGPEDLGCWTGKHEGTTVGWLMPATDADWNCALCRRGICFRRYVFMDDCVIEVHDMAGKA